LARQFLQRFTICINRLFEHCTTALALAEQHERIGAIAHGLSPLQRNPFTRSLLQRLGIGLDCLSKHRAVIRSLAEQTDCRSKIVLSKSPDQWIALARQL